VASLRDAARRRIPAHFAIGAKNPLSTRDLRTIEHGEYRRIGKVGAHVRDHLGGTECPRRVNAVGEQDDEHLPFRVDPHRCSRESSVTVGGTPEISARAVITFRGVPPKRAVTDGSAREQLHGRAADDLHAVIFAAIEHHLSEDRQVSSGAEEPGVSRHAPKRERVLVVDFAAKWVPARRRYFSRRDAVAERVCWAKEGIVHPQRSEHAAIEEFVERFTGNDFHQQAEQIGAEIRVDVAGSRACFERSADDCRTRLEGTLGDPPDVAARRQSRGVGEELANGDPVLFSAAESGKIRHDSLVEVYLLLVEENHDRGGRPDYFGERSDIVDRLLGINHGAGGEPRQLAEAHFHHRRSLSAHDDGGTGVATGLDATRDNALDCLETSGRHANVRWRLDGQTVAGTGDCQCGENDPEQR
jgi:hypothetical protein